MADDPNNSTNNGGGSTFGLAPAPGEDNSNFPQPGATWRLTPLGRNMLADRRGSPDDETFQKTD